MRTNWQRHFSVFKFLLPALLPKSTMSQYRQNADSSQEGRHRAKTRSYCVITEAHNPTTKSSATCRRRAQHPVSCEALPCLSQDRDGHYPVIERLPTLPCGTHATQDHFDESVHAGLITQGPPEAKNPLNWKAPCKWSKHS